MRLTTPRRTTETATPGNAVNLLSPWVLEEIKVRQLRKRFVYGALAVLLLVGGGWTYQQMSLRTVETQLASEQASGDTLQEEIDALGPVRDYVGAVDRRATSVEGAMRTEVSFAQVLAALDVALPPGVAIEDVSASLVPEGTTAEAGGTTAVAPTLPAGEAEGTDPAADGTEATTTDTVEDDDAAKTRGLSDAGCVGPDPFGVAPAIGCLTVSGIAIDRAAVGELVDAIAAKGAFVEPFVSATTVGDAQTAAGVPTDAVAFVGTVALTPEVFSRRYDHLPIKLDLQEKTP